MELPQVVEKNAAALDRSSSSKDHKDINNKQSPAISQRIQKKIVEVSHQNKKTVPTEPPPLVPTSLKPKAIINISSTSPPPLVYAKAPFTCKRPTSLELGLNPTEGCTPPKRILTEPAAQRVSQSSGRGGGSCRGARGVSRRGARAARDLPVSSKPAIIPLGEHDYIAKVRRPPPPVSPQPESGESQESLQPVILKVVSRDNCLPKAPPVSEPPALVQRSSALVLEEDRLKDLHLSCKSPPPLAPLKRTALCEGPSKDSPSSASKAINIDHHSSGTPPTPSGCSTPSKVTQPLSQNSSQPSAPCPKKAYSRKKKLNVEEGNLGSNKLLNQLQRKYDLKCHQAFKLTSKLKNEKLKNSRYRSHISRLEEKLDTMSAYLQTVRSDISQKNKIPLKKNTNFLDKNMYKKSDPEYYKELDEKMNSFAVTLNMLSCEAYAFVRKVFNKSGLPSVATINRWYAAEARASGCGAPDQHSQPPPQAGNEDTSAITHLLQAEIEMAQQDGDEIESQDDRVMGILMNDVSEYTTVSERAFEVDMQGLEGVYWIKNNSTS